MAHKVGKGSTKNNRYSNPKYLGVKRYGGQFINAGTIILKQRGTVTMPGENVGVAKDHTLYALIDGKIKFEPASKTRRKVSVYTA